MKKFSERHSTFFMWCTVGLTAVVVLLFGYIIFDVTENIKNDLETKEADSYLMRTELCNTVRDMREAAKNGSVLEMYHYAKTASNQASRLGNKDASILFSQISQKIMSEGECTEDICSKADAFLENGSAVADFSMKNYEEPASEIVKKVKPKLTSSFLTANALERAELILKSDNVLKTKRLSDRGEVICTCHNAYFVIDERSLLPLEFCISFERGAAKLSTDECVECGRLFIVHSFPKEKLRGLKQTEIEEVGDGICCVSFLSEDGWTASVGVSMDSGRIVRFLAR